ncbi:hypothetical protein TL16_g07176 [Triparma laevis f. inornata]|uniref:Protein kinase domain-containing protein n=1 Tax=Triparma laevis f. inornata TaxID=1714386 RepID=A0A9W7AVI5_9STRA|nr:hypothetical protein TL16_g07176 [Triparma laevis f. inornata]
MDALNELGDEVFREQTMSVGGLTKEASLLTIKYTCLLHEQSSTVEGMKLLVGNAREFNDAHKISGKISFGSTFEENYSVSQTIEGPVKQVVLLWNRIKADPRVKEIVDSSYNLGGGEEVGDLGHGGSWNKTVFVVEDMHTNLYYAMKEVLVMKNAHGLKVSNESDVLRHIWGKGVEIGLFEGRTGFVRAPDVFRELVKVSMVYPLYPLDLFHAINHNTAMFRTEGDIKPENICLDENGNCVLLDFELAVRVQEESNKMVQGRNVILGTSLYIAPETYRRLEYSFATDLWAVAMVCCDLHSSRLPWEIDVTMSLDEVGRAIVGSVPVKPRGIGDELWTFLEKILVGGEERMGVEEAISDPLFANFEFIKYEEVTEKFEVGNVFDRHEWMSGIREIVRKRGVLGGAGVGKGGAGGEKWREVRLKDVSSMVGGNRREFVEGMERYEEK